MSLILGLESSSSLCSVALFEDDRTVALRESDEAFSHTRKITVFIQEVLKKRQRSISELDAVAISSGPGSYTGLRVASATAKGICFGLKIPLISVPTLDAIVQEAMEKSKGEFFVPMIDARRDEVYTKVIKRNGKEHLGTTNLILDSNSYKDILSDEKDIVICGEGARKAKNLIDFPNAEFKVFESSAKHLSYLAHRKFEDQVFDEISMYEPFYFKSPRITKSRKKLF